MHQLQMPDCHSFSQSALWLLYRICQSVSIMLPAGMLLCKIQASHWYHVASQLFSNLLRPGMHPHDLFPNCCTAQACPIAVGVGTLRLTRFFGNYEA